MPAQCSYCRGQFEGFYVDCPIQSWPNFLFQYTQNIDWEVLSKFSRPIKYAFDGCAAQTKMEYESLDYECTNKVLRWGSISLIDLYPLSSLTSSRPHRHVFGLQMFSKTLNDQLWTFVNEFRIMLIYCFYFYCICVNPTSCMDRNPYSNFRWIPKIDVL